MNATLRRSRRPVSDDTGIIAERTKSCPGCTERRIHINHSPKWVKGYVATTKIERTYMGVPFCAVPS